jgi:hypothetical protein
MLSQRKSASSSLCSPANAAAARLGLGDRFVSHQGRFHETQIGLCVIHETQTGLSLTDGRQSTTRPSAIETSSGKLRTAGRLPTRSASNRRIPASRSSLSSREQSENSIQVACARQHSACPYNLLLSTKLGERLAISTFTTSLVETSRKLGADLSFDRFPALP